MDTSIFHISPLDGRYQAKTQPLRNFSSEAALILYRLRVEAAWLLHLSEDNIVGSDLKLGDECKKVLQEMSTGHFSEDAPTKVKQYELDTNHDVKAVEYYLRDVLRKAGAKEGELAFIHFACTSEDINNLAYGLMLKELRQNILAPTFEKLWKRLHVLTSKYADLPMLSRTHGQTASPSTLGKEVNVFAWRLKRQWSRLSRVEIDGKMSGATGNYNAHLSAYPEVDWQKLAKEFVESKLSLTHNAITTQIENHDGLVEYFDTLKRINTISIDFCRDVWSYISLGYFKQKLKEGEVGSSTMPHKVNPIDFENAEGNFGLSSSLCTHFSDKLPISRWQRDLSDSTVLRTVGVAVGHHYLAMQSLLKGIDKLEVDREKIEQDLDGAWEVLGEAVQTVMRRYGVEDAYERIKKATRGKPIDMDGYISIVESTEELPSDVKERLKSLTPALYIGAAPELAVLEPN